MANPYTSGGPPHDDPFADGFKRPPPAAAPATAAAAPASGAGAQFYDPPPVAVAGGSVPYQPPPFAGGAPPPPVQVGVPIDGSQQYAPPHAAGGAPSGAPGGGAAAPADVPPPTRDLATSKFWTMEFYQQFFDVDTEDVLLRMGNTLLPFLPPDFLAARNWHHGELGGLAAERLRTVGAVFAGEEQKERTPDLYGPFWLCTTLWVVLAIVGNVMSRFAYSKSLLTNPQQSAWAYDFTVASAACFTIYAFVGLVPLVIWGLMMWKSVPAGLLDILCLYGYSMFPFLLAAILSAFPSNAVQWLACVLCGLWSLMYLLANLWKLWKQSLERVWFLGIVLFVTIMHVGLFLAFKLYFLAYNF